MSYSPFTQYNEDAAHASGDKGVQVLAVRKATPANLSGADGDYEPLQISAGRLWTSSTIGAALPAGTNNIGDVDVLTINGVAPAFGSGLRGATVLRVTIATDDVVPASQSGTWNITNISGTVSLPTGASTLAEQQSQTTALQLIDDAIVADDAAFTPATTKVMMAGFTFDDVASDAVNEGDAGAARMSSRREIYTQIRDAAGNERGLNVAADGSIAVTIATVPSHAVTNAGTFVVQENGAALTALELIDDGVYTDDTSTHTTGASKGYGMMAVADPTDAAVNANDFGHVAMTTSRALKNDLTSVAGNAILAGNGASGTGALRVTIANDSTGVLATVTTVTTVSTLTGSGIAHDGVDSGNPHKIGAKAETSPKGITAVADGDRTDLYADADGILMVKLNTSGADLISERVSNTDGASTAFTNFSAVASTYNYVTAIHAFRTDAGTTPIYIDFRDGTAGSIKYSLVLPPNGGATLPASGTPYFKTSANTALAFDVSAATTTVYISVTGFQSKV